MYSRLIAGVVVLVAAAIVVRVTGDEDPGADPDADADAQYSRDEALYDPFIGGDRPDGVSLASHQQNLHPDAAVLGHKKQPVLLTHRTDTNPLLRFGSQDSGLSGITSKKRPGGSNGRKCPVNTQCVPMVVCSPFFDEIDHDKSHMCSLSNDTKGICCPQLRIKAPSSERFMSVLSEPSVEVRKTSFSGDVVNEAVRSSLWQLEERDKLENLLQKEKIMIIKRGTPEYSHFKLFPTSSRAMKINRDARTLLGASEYLATRFQLTPLEAGFGLQQISLKDSIIEGVCPAIPACGRREWFYRSYDGSCNNIQTLSFGQAGTPLQRLTRPRYSDGLDKPRMSVTGSPLPSARLVSTSISPDADKPNDDLTLYVMLMGQFIDHDTSHVPIVRFADHSGIQCCNEDGSTPVDPSFIHPSCFPIDVPEDDPFHANRTGRRCMNFVRSMISPKNCKLGFAEQMNDITHYLDSSNIYGSSETEADELRAFTDGLLKVQERQLLPANPEVEECESIGFECFRAGDSRVNEQVELTVMHTLWLRFHNLIARELKRLNRWSDDETLFLESRRIVNAMYQHILYNEWLPIVLGWEFMKEWNLLPLRNGEFSRLYDSSVDPSITNEFATVAFRFGHTLVQGKLDLVSQRKNRKTTLDLVKHYHNPSILYTSGKLGDFVRGIAQQPPQMTDKFVSSSLTDRLFETERMPFGLDLVALNTQRGRDHGVGTYNDLRELAGLPRAKNFDDFKDNLPVEVVEAFSSLYDSVDDVDPFVAGIAEDNVDGSILGRTFRAIIGYQFAKLKYGDRFFYDLGSQSTSFTRNQLNQIQQMSFARVLCETGDNIKFMQPLAMRAARGMNGKVSCRGNTIPRLDLRPWRFGRATKPKISK